MGYRGTKGRVGFVTVLALLASVRVFGNGGEVAVTSLTSSEPPPFVSEAVEISLGSSGSTVILMTAQDGGYTLDEEAFPSGGEVTAANGNVYELTLSDGVWTAAFKAPDPIELGLGTSGETVTITMIEDRSYWIGGMSIADGSAIQASNGNSYTLSRSPDGMWTATYSGVEVQVELGTSRQIVTVVREEHGAYSLNGQALESGDVFVAGSGNEYKLTLGPDGSWTAAYEPIEQIVPLGASGTITLTRAENGNWFYGQVLVEQGGAVVGSNGVSYRLSLVNGFWSARVVPETIRIAGTPLRATFREDGRGYRVGTSALLPIRGRGSVTVGGAMYHVWLDGDRLHGARFDSAPHGTTPSEANYQIGLSSGLARLSRDDEDTIANELRTTLIVGGGEFAVGTLLDVGSASYRSETFLSKARQEIQALRDRVELVLSALADDDSARNQYLRRTWRQVQSAIDSLFGADVVTLDWTTNVDEVLDALDEVLEALSTETEFQAATRRDGTGLFEAAELEANKARQAYRARMSESEVVTGAIGGTRYGAVTTRARNRAINSLSVRASGADQGAFAYSTIPDTQWTWQIPSSGNAVYEGGTVAISGDRTIYTGDIALLVRIRSRTVSGLITNLKDQDGQPWIYLFAGAETIRFPEAQLTSQANWSYQTDGAEQASIDYLSKFFHPSASAKSSFVGHLLGTGDDAGSEAVGVWSVGVSTDGSNYLEGGFGALRVGEDSEFEPVPDKGEQSATTVASSEMEIGDGSLTLHGTQYGPNLETTATEADWDDQALVLDGGRRVEETYQVLLEEIFSRQGAESAYLGTNLVDLAREEIAELREQLVSVVDVDGDNEVLLQLRANIWGQINERVRARLFGTADNALEGRDYLNDADVPPSDPRKWSNGYPVSRSGEPDDVSALAAVDAVLAALANSSALLSATRAGGGGVFTRADGEPFRAVGADGIEDIWDRSEGRVKILLGSTDHTRFGAWRKQTAPNAWSDYQDRSEDDENGPNSFAYSQLPQSTYSDVRYPSGGSASYEGETIAVQGTTFYRGAIEVITHWHSGLEGDFEAGLLTGIIQNLQTADGDPLTYTDSTASAAQEIPIEALILEGISIQTDSEKRLFFSDGSPVVARLRFATLHDADVDLTADPSATTSIEGKFVGQQLDGPQGVIGTWTLRDGGESTIGTGGTVFGAFGAELRP